VKPELADLQEQGINYSELSLRDEESEEILEKLRPAADWIETALKGGGRVLVNCYAGTSRSATVVLAFLITHRGLSLEEALVTVKKCRDICPNNGFLKYVSFFCHCFFYANVASCKSTLQTTDSLRQSVRKTMDIQACIY